MWVPYYITSIVIAIILIIKDWDELNEFLDDLSSDEEKAFMIFLMIVFAPGVILFFIIAGCINLYFYVKNHRTNKKIDIDKQLNKLPRLMAEYDRLLRKPEDSKLHIKYVENGKCHIEHVKLRNWDEK
jgi:uncharacterized membrane protein YciS (DUF1049 family)